ncbi:GSCOCG00012713001-RA-CDS, partial [Cotesia congregata]
YPRAWRENRTTLIPKPGQDLSQAKNWRPITVGSLIERIYSSLLDAKMRQVIPQSHRQKGFTADDGCRMNILILGRVMEKVKAKHGGIITILDISKAFDTLPHAAIRPALERKGVPTHIIEQCLRMYEGCKTVIKTRNGNVEIDLKRGVKQGNPMSPLFFNLGIEELLVSLEEETEGILINEGNDEVDVTAAAFADDIILFGRNRTEAVRQVDMVHTYLRSLGMSLSASKCQTFQIISGYKTWCLTDPELVINEEPVPLVEPDMMFKYLGAKFNPWTALLKGQEVPIIMRMVKLTRRLALKPWQKLDLLQTYIFPRFIYALSVNTPSRCTIRMLDRDIRVEVKEMLHLVPSTSTGFLYTSKSRGGLGLLSFEKTIYMSALKMAMKLEEAKDPVLEEVKRSERLRKGFEDCANFLGVERPRSQEECEAMKRTVKNRYEREHADLVIQGEGAKDFAQDKIGNTWLRMPGLLKGARFIDAIRLRTNTMGTRVVLAQTRPTVDVRCRRCGMQPETLAHIIGACTHTKPARIRRHDEIKNLVAKKLAENGHVYQEMSVNEFGELKRPDIVYVKNGKVYVLDITVRYEKGNSMEEARIEKEKKYKITAGLVAMITECESGGVLPIVVGSRGHLPRRTMEILKTLGFNRSHMLTIVMIAMRSSLEIANGFFDYNERRLL